MIVHGFHAIEEALGAEEVGVQRLYVVRGRGGARLQRLLDLARERGVPIRFEPPEALARRAGTDRHQGLVAEVSPARLLGVDDLLARSPSLLVVVDGVEDPHNLGAVLRTAEAAGVEGVLVPDRRSSPVTAAVVKASAGAALHLPLARIGNVARTLASLREAGFHVVGLDMDGETAPDGVLVDRPLVVVVGGEHRGLRRLVREHCDQVVALPMRGRVNSLNLSVAAGVLLYQILLKRSP